MTADFKRQSVRAVGCVMSRTVRLAAAVRDITHPTEVPGRLVCGIGGAQ